jgi:hypothetical protein
MQANLIALLQSANPHLIVLFKMELPSETVRLSTGVQVTYDSESYIPADPEWGVLSHVGVIKSGQTGRAVSPDVGLMIASDAKIEAISAKATEDSRIRIWWGAVDPATGAVEIDDENGPVCTMYLDTTDTSFPVGQRQTLIKTYAATARQLRPNTRQRLNPSFHKSIYSGETGLDNVTGIADADGWRSNDPPLRRGSSSGGGSGGGPGLYNIV